MSNSRAALRYAKAVLDLATEKKAADPVENDMRNIAEAIDQNRELQNLLKSPIIKTAIKKEIVQEIFSTAHELTQGLIAILTNNKRISLLQEVAQQYTALYKKQKGEATACITTAVPLPSNLEAKIKAAVTTSTNSTIAIKNTIDENILGGFVLRIGDLQYDASIAHKLNQLKKEFTTHL